jgi:hypothetical protein
MTSVKRKSRMGRPVTIDADQAVGIRLPSKLVKDLDAWAKSEGFTRSEAIRRLVEIGLAAQAPAMRDSHTDFQRQVPEPTRGTKPKR